MAEKSVTSISNTIATVTGVLSGGTAWVTANYEFLIPTVISILVLVVSFFYQCRRDKRQQEEHDLRVQLLKRDLEKG